MKKFYLLIILLFFARQYVTAQTTLETFESPSVIVNVASFTSGGKTFNLSSSYLTFKTYSLAGTGYNGSNKYLQVEDSAGPEALGQSATITSISGAFKVSDFWLYVTGNSAFTPGVTSNGAPGSITFTGKLGGSPVFTVVKNTTGTNIGLTLPANGFYYINLASEGGTDNTNKVIDQLEIQLSNNYDYLAVDNFTFANGALPPTVSTTTASNVKSLSATFGGNVTADGGDASVERGIVWSTNPSPTIGNNKVQIGIGTGPYTSVVTGLPAGTLIYYRAYATNSGGTAYGTQSTLTTNAALSAPALLTKTDVTCFGLNNGTASISPTGGALPYTYSWSPSGGSGSSASNLSIGTYTVTVTDNESTQITRSVTIGQPSELTTAPVKTDVSCFGGSNGIASVSVSGGAPGYTYVWSTGSTAQTISGLIAGNYTVLVTDANNCTKTQVVTVGQPTVLQVSATKTDVSCKGGANGTATVVASGGIGNYTYSWAPSGGTNATATGLTAGTYTVTVKDNNNNLCTQTATVTVGEPSDFLSATMTKTDASCNGNANGTATVTATGGTSPYTYSWSPSGGTANEATGLGAGLYTVTITDANSCSTTATANIIEPSIITATNSTTPVSCNGGANGTATIVASGGTPGYTYLWSNGSTDATATGLTAGTYSVDITDSKSCTATISGIVVGDAPLIVSNLITSNVSCNGGANGTASVAPTGGAGGYSYVWSTGATTSSISGLAAGNYSVDITDNNTCVITENFTITQPTVLTASQGSTTNVSCNGGANGTATVLVSGGSPLYTYSWAPSGGTFQTAIGLAAGTYTVTVTDANSCQTTQSFVISEPPIFNITTSQVDILCSGTATGSAGVVVTGGTAPYSYSWSPTGGTAATATGLTGGTYTVTITDGNACMTTRSFTIGEPSELVLTPGPITNVNCFGEPTGSATVSATGGTGSYTYSWAPTGGTAATASGLAAGTYTVTVTDENGCEKTESFTITEPTAPLTASTSSTGVSCYGGSNGIASVTASGGTGPYTYAWAPLGGTNSFIIGRPAGNYTCTITDNKGCTYIANVNISTPAQFSSTITKTDVSCYNGSNGTATVVPSGGTSPYTYSWSPSGGTGQTASGLAEGIYTVTIQDNNGCAYQNTVSIDQPNALSLTASQTNVLCNGGFTGTATVTVSGGTPTYTYLWTPYGGTAATATGLSIGTYTCTVTDSNNCSITETFAITEPPVLTATTSQIDATCITQGQGSVVVSGGMTPYSYLWSNGATTATANLSAGNHSCVITDDNGCTITKNFTIGTTNTLVATQAQTDNLCNGGNTGSASVVPSGAPGPFTYVWSPFGGNTDTANGLTAGNYSVTITSNNGCSIVKNFTIGEPTAIQLTPSQSDNICNGASAGQASVAVTGGTGTYTYSWAPSGGTAATASGLSAGTYTVTVTDANSCTATQSFTITEPDALTAVPSQTNVSCNAGNDGTASVTVTGGTGTYTYSWAPSGGTAASASGLAAGTYTVTVTDANSCTTTQSFTITEPDALAVVPSQTNVSCNAGNDGTASVTVTGGTGAYTYSWSPSGGTAASASGLSAGTYTVTVTDANSCTTTQSFTITEPDALAVAPSQTNVSCNNGSNGTASVSVTGGTGAYTYSWSPSGGNAATALGLSVGTYTVTVTDANSCTITESFTITEPDALSVIPSQTNVSCNNGSNGTASVSVTGGTGAYTYSWAPSGGTAATASGLSAGTYTVTITDANSCTINESFTITEPDALTIVPSQTNVSCNAANNGTATVTVSGGIGAYTYSWAPLGGTAPTASGLAPGTYTVTVTDANSCTATQSFTITEPDALTVIGSQTDVLCNNGNNGTASVIVSGGTGAYTYSWSPSGGNAATASGLSAGTYTVTITDDNSCTITESFTITEPDALTAVPSQTNVSCNNGNNGTASVTVSGGTGAYTYSWSPSGGTAASASGLSAGTYTVTVTDANSCTATQSFTITEPDALSVIPSQTNVFCNNGNNGTASVTVTGGTGAYTYSWAPSGGTAATASGLAPGTYTVTITDANSCTITESFTITEPDALTIVPSQTNVSCNAANNGTASVTVTGGTGAYTYSWAPSGGNAATASGLSAGTYTVTVTDSNSCTITESFTITEPDALAAVPSQINVSCNNGNNGTASVIVSGGTGAYTYSWSPSGGTAASASGLSAGTYTVTITDDNSCTITESFTITEPDALTAVPSQTNVSCNNGNNGTASVIVSGGTGAYTYSWAPSGGNAAAASGLAPGTYTVTVTDANSCTITESFTITEPDALAAVPSQTNVSCNNGNNGTASVIVSGGTGAYTYSWAPSGGNTASASGLSAGTYTVTITDANSCTITESFTITEPDALTAVPSQTNVSCNNGNNGTASVIVSGGTGAYTYSWTPSGGNAATASGLAAGTYTVTVTDANSCTITESFTITEPDALTAVPSQINVSCNNGNNGTASVTVTGGTGAYTYSWAPSGGNAATASGLAAGTYTVTVTDANSCTITESFTITEPDALTAVPSQINVSCNNGNNGTASVIVSGGTGAYTYSWAPSGGTAATASGLAPGTYTVTVTDANSCIITESFTITEPDALTAVSSQTNVSCNNGNNGTASVSVTGGTGAYTYAWAPSGGTAATASGLSAGTYTVTVTDANSCTITESFTITEPVVLSVIPSQANVTCNGGNDGTASVSVTGGTGAYTYAWAPSGGTAASASGLAAGTYTVTVTDANSCTITESFTITEPNVLTIDATIVNVSCIDGNNGSAAINVTGGTGSYTYLWSPTGETTSSISGLTAGNYSVTVTDANACSITESIVILQPANPVNLSTAEATDITVLGASLSGTVSVGADTDKGECLTEVGFVYALNTNPTIADIKISTGNTLGDFATALTGLRGNRTYYVRTYAINSNGFVNYGNEISFTTQKYTLTIVAASHTKVYGTLDPVFNYTAAGFANGDNSSIIKGLLSRASGENVGTYAIELGTINAGADYVIAFTGAQFEITKASQTISWNQILDFGCTDSNQVELTATTDSGLPITYTIANPTIGTISGTTLTITGSGSTTITAVQNGDQNHTAATSVTTPIEVSQSGLVIQQWADVLFFDNKSNNFVSYQWYKNGTAVSGATRQYYSENQPLNGSYYVIAKDKNGNSIKSCPIEATGSIFTKKLKLYPNPVRTLSEFTLECDFSESQLNGAEITIFDLTGKLVQTVTNVKAKNQIIAPAQSSIYVVVLTLNNGQKKTINLLVK